MYQFVNYVSSVSFLSDELQQLQADDRYTRLFEGTNRALMVPEKRVKVSIETCGRSLEVRPAKISDGELNRGSFWSIIHRDHALKHAFPYRFDVRIPLRTLQG